MKILTLRINALSEHVEQRLPFSVYTVGTEEQQPMTRLRGYSAYQFIVTFSGRGKFRLLGQSKWDMVSTNQILFIPADIPHEYISEGYEPWNVGFVSFSAEANSLEVWRLGDVPKIFAVQQTHRLFELIEQIWNKSGAEHDYWTSSELFLTFLSEIAKQRYNSSADRLFSGSNAVAHAAARFLRDHVNRPATTITELAGQLGYSRKQLTRLFINTYHTTPLQYLKQQRLIGAARLLKAHPERTAAEIARQVGMEPVYFSRAFRMKFGVTPMEFKNISNEIDLE
ncbi:AraC family transcriptional regulator [Paenibacillus dakarensis]|uniref:AraC family transcriptional regulator n=1 Tax=Paenibacillus dakarensis TaxID=1527293 RepID=UPI0006D57A44|nr:AraC family transcriptional regulator [Paenibacillus dakarensis]